MYAPGTFSIMKEKSSDAIAAGPSPLTSASPTNAVAAARKSAVCAGSFTVGANR
jgi:hypothetical protein